MEITKELFKTIMNEYIIPLIPVADTKIKGEDGKELSRIVDLESCPNSIKKSRSTITIYKDDKSDKTYWFFHPQTDTPTFFFRLALSCDANYTKDITLILNCIIRTVSRFQVNDPSEIKYYLDELCQSALTLGVCTSLVQGDQRFKLAEAVTKLESWTKKYYEGKKVPFGIIIDFDNSNKSKNPDFLHFLDSKFSASFTDGVFSAMLLNAKGKILDHIAFPTKKYQSASDDTEIGSKNYPIAPTRFKHFSRMCYNNKIGLIALSNGDILVITKRQLCFAKREGKWHEYNYSGFFRPCLEKILSFSQKARNKSSRAFTENISKAVYQSLLDSSFSHTGACLALIDFAEHGKKKEFKEMLGTCLIVPDKKSDGGNEKTEEAEITTEKDITKEEEKKNVIQTLTYYSNTPRSFVKLSNKLRVELMSMDGAVVLDRRGCVRTAGAILKIQPGSEEGARYAAARALSRYGVSFKVSEDGGITGLYNEKIVFRTE